MSHQALDFAILMIDEFIFIYTVCFQIIDFSSFRVHTGKYV